jgi:hypothetical protein
MVLPLDYRPRAPVGGPGVDPSALLVSGTQHGGGVSGESRERTPSSPMGRSRGRVTVPPTSTVVPVG